jgi:hypothetical protein
MDEANDGANPPAETDVKLKRSYEPPAIKWREPYEPVSFGVSCALVPGNPQCEAGGPTKV